MGELDRSPTLVRELPRHHGAGADAARALDRDARVPELLDVPADAMERLRALELGVVGLGSVGSTLVDLLARLGVASLFLVDRGTLKPESLLTHPILPGDLGRAKAELAGERAKAVSPGTRVQVWNGALEDLPRAGFAGLSAVVLASDNHACELELNQRCVHLGLPLIQAAVYPPTQSAQVRLLPNASDAAPCLACGYVERDWEDADRGTLFACAGDGTRAITGAITADSRAPEPGRVPTRSLPQHCAAAATLAVGELVRFALGLTAGASHVLEHCATSQALTTTSLPRRPDCPVDHRRWRLVQRPGRLARATLRELVAEAVRMPLDSEPSCSVSVEGLRFALLGKCACPRHPDLGRFIPATGPIPDCAGCGLPLVPHPIYTYDAAPLRALAGQLDRPLESLGAEAPASVLVESDARAVLFTEGSR